MKEMPVTITVGELPGWASEYTGEKFHGCFCDPPYHLTQVSRGGSPRKFVDNPYGRSRVGCERGFMGKTWDGGDVAFNPETWGAILTLLHPGAHLLAFGGTRTFHHLACAIEDAGFEIRDTLMWVYGSGFPKSLDVSKAMDKRNGVEREDKFEGSFERRAGPTGNRRCEQCGKWLVSGSPCQCPRPQDKPVSDVAKQWNGYGTALKPAWEPIILARKPIEGTVAENVQKYGCGAINVDGCRIGFASETDREQARINGLGPVQRFKTTKQIFDGGRKNGGFQETHNTNGRWPANLIHDGSQMVLELFPNTASGAMKRTVPAYNGESNTGFLRGRSGPENQHGDSGSAARFFYCAKASKSERGEGNDHPTVKPIALCQYLAKLILPPIENSRLLVPFTGSGSECIGGNLAGWSEIVGVDREEHYATIARERVRELCR